MKKVLKSRYTFYSLLILAAGMTVYVMIVMPSLGKGHKMPASSTVQKQGDTASEGHHKAAGNTAPPLDLTNQTQVTIKIKDFAYSKQNIKIRKGTTVMWINEDSVEHNVMKEHESDGDAHDAPEGDEVKSDVLAGPLLRQGESYRFTFNEVGTNPYHCSPHPYMKGSVTVVE